MRKAKFVNFCTLRRELSSLLMNVAAQQPEEFHLKTNSEYGRNAHVLLDIQSIVKHNGKIPTTTIGSKGTAKAGVNLL